jgi:spermidine synthase
MKKSSKTLRQQFEEMLAWTAQPPSNPRLGKPYLVKRNGSVELHFDRLTVQSEMAIDTPDELVLDYTRAMMSFLLLNPAPSHIAMIGLGGGSLAKYCYRHLPHTEISVIEINPDVIALRNEFEIPPDDARFRVLLGDGAAYVSAPDRELEVLMVDGFEAGGQPAQLSSQRFYDQCYASLADDGILVVNLWGNDAHYHEYVAKIKSSFADRIAVISVDDRLNKIVFALKSTDFPPAPASIRQHADLLCLSHPLHFQAKSQKLIYALRNRTT